MSDTVLIGILIIVPFFWMGFGCWALDDSIIYKDNWKKRLVVYLMYGPISILTDLAFNGLPSLIDKIYSIRDKFRRFVNSL